MSEGKEFEKKINQEPGGLHAVKEGEVLNIAIMGLGKYGHMIAEAMNGCKRVKVTGAISGSPSKIKEWQSKYSISEKNCYTYENFDEIKNNPDIDAVYIITPNSQHHEQCLRVAAAKKHVLCEKPMAVNATEGQEMVDACKEAGVKLLIGYRMHFEVNTLEIVRLRNEGEFGPIKFFQGLCGFKIDESSKNRLNYETAGGGALMDMGIYAINGSRYMVGEEPMWVTAQEVKTNPEMFEEGVDESITFQMGFPSGAVASCLSTYAANNLDKFFLLGENGFAEMQPATGYDPIQAWTHNGKLEMGHDSHQVTQMDQMAMIILDGNKPTIPIDGEEGLKDLKIIDAIYKAVKTGQKVVLDL
jgi:predicted dehydrogenase